MFVPNSNLEIITLEKIKVVGLSLEKLGWPKQGDGSIYSKMWQLYDKEYRDKINNIVDPDVAYWFWFMDRDRDPDHYDYLIGNPVSDFADVDEALTAFAIPAGRYIKHTFNAEDFGALVDGVLSTSKNVVKLWAQENGERINEYITAGIQVYPKKDLSLEHPSMYTLTPIE